MRVGICLIRVHVVRLRCLLPLPQMRKKRGGVNEGPQMRKKSGGVDGGGGVSYGKSKESL